MTTVAHIEPIACVCNTALSVLCILMVTYCERADLFTLVCYVFIIFPFGDLGQVWYLIVSILIYS